MNQIRTEYVGAALALGSIGLFVYYYNLNVTKEPEIDQGPFVLAKSSIRLTHQHPDGWGSGAVIKKMKGEPLQSSVSLIVSDLQKYGYAVVENLYEDLCVEKLGYEVKDVVRNGIANNKDNRKTLVAEPGIFIDALIDSVSNTFLKELNVAYTEYHSDSNLNTEEKSAYCHPHMTFCEFNGFSAKQLRLRLPGEALGLHVDRASAKLTALFYLNEEPTHGDLVLYQLPEEKRMNPENKALLVEGGLKNLDQLEKVKIAPMMNKFVVFWSDCIPHEITRIDSNRLSFQVFFSTTEEATTQ